MRNSRTPFFLAAVMCLTAWAGSAAAQATSAPAGGQVAPEPSLADAARKARAAKKTEPQAAKKVWTDDNIPTAPREIPAAAATEGAEAPSEQLAQGATSPIGAQAAAKQAAGAQGNAGGQAGTAAAADDDKAKAELESKWREKFAQAHKKLEDDQKDADLMQREYNLKRQQYYSDPNTAMREQYQYPSGRGGDLNDLAKKIDEKKAAIEQDKQAISDLEDELRKAGLPAGWSRP